MKAMITAALLAVSLAVGSLPATASAQAAPTAEVKKDEVVIAQATPTETAPAAAEVAKPEEKKEEPKVTVDKGDITWMMVATVLVVAMVVPGLALFYGGLVRAKNMLSVLMQVMVVFSLIVVLWFVYGYSLAFTGTNAFFGGFEKLLLSGVKVDSLADTFTANVKIPEYIFVAFQSTFAGITCALIVGAFAERIKFSAVLLFSVIWFTFSYLPIAHMV